jgi:hypothetical protein
MHYLQILTSMCFRVSAHVSSLYLALSADGFAEPKHLEEYIGQV